MRLLRALLGVFGLIAVASFKVIPRLLDALGFSQWTVQLVVAIALIQLMALIYDPAIDWWVDLIHDKRWGISNQTPRGFVADQLKSLVLMVVVTVALAVPIYALVRVNEFWWIWGWIVVTVFSIIFGFLFPVVVAPIFNRFTPLEDGPLAVRVQELASAAGVDLRGALVADASRRSTRDNAYVAGLGRTRRVVLFDTILEHPVEIVAQVIAHELGHWRLGHLRRQLPLSAMLTLAVFAWLQLVSGWSGLWAWAGADGMSDPRGLPVVLLAVQPAATLVSMVGSWVSRAFERQADESALQLLRDPDTMLSMQQRLHTKNLADLDPSWWTRLNASHPPAAERMAFTYGWATAEGLATDSHR